jgi:ribosomal protein S6
LCLPSLPLGRGLWYSARYTMAETAVAEEKNTAEAGSVRIYEVGYVLVPTVKDEESEKIVGSIRAEIEKAGGTFIAEGAPSLMRLAYPMAAPAPLDAGKGARRTEYDRGHFGWIKFETSVESAIALERSLGANENVMRSLVFRTVREDTRAKMKAPTLREVKRTDTIKTARRVEEAAGPVSEEELEKALQDITKE